LQWLRANGVPWDDLACRHAARGGHLETLKWLRANHAPWDDENIFRAARHDHIREWLALNK
jgi:hypothetical protein